MTHDNYLWIENEDGGKSVWANRKLYIAIDDAMLFLDVAHEMRGNITIRTARRQTADVQRQLNNK